ncbi:MAG: AbrB/MazE/SpoVT family DNA-binding domain-containing protein [Kiritimatiellae bacterium]|nr:AbrB/MazE/SpoVT family DNA-binding domain-containing protein [Kiritimatiellia bacterium]
MYSVTVSPKFQVVIPRPVRDSLKLKAGQKIQVIEYDGRIEMIPEKDITELYGFLEGINIDFKDIPSVKYFSKD